MDPKPLHIATENPALNPRLVANIFFLINILLVSSAKTGFEANIPYLSPNFSGVGQPVKTFY